MRLNDTWNQVKRPIEHLSHTNTSDIKSKYCFNINKKLNIFDSNLNQIHVTFFTFKIII